MKYINYFITYQVYLKDKNVPPFLARTMIQRSTPIRNLKDVEGIEDYIISATNNDKNMSPCDFVALLGWQRFKE